MTFIRQIESEDLPQWKPHLGRRVRMDHYLFSNDAQENARLRMQHDLFWLAWHRNYFAPVRHPERILDIACGPCVWGLEVLQEHPTAKIFNVDIDEVPFKRYLETLPPKTVRKLPPLDNFFFIQADARQPLDFPDHTFDLVHARLPDPFLSEEQWPWFIRQMTRLAKPDGWVEVLAGGHFWTGQPTFSSVSLLEAEIELCRRVGVAPTGGPGFSRYLEQAGITNAFRRRDILGKTRKQQELGLKDILHLIRETKKRLLKYGIMQEAGFEDQIAQLAQDVATYGFYLDFSRAWFQPQAQQPAMSEATGEFPVASSS
jgi:ubiquinone/menaquinone biosynthesis C-methylase UbiE